MSSGESPFLYDIMCGSLKILFRNGCCCIKYHPLVMIVSKKIREGGKGGRGEGGKGWEMITNGFIIYVYDHTYLIFFFFDCKHYITK